VAVVILHALRKSAKFNIIGVTMFERAPQILFGLFLVSIYLSTKYEGYFLELSIISLFASVAISTAFFWKFFLKRTIGFLSYKENRSFVKAFWDIWDFSLL
jgi:hypothetical protein